MERRKFVVGLGALASGSAAAMGTGAFGFMNAERTVSVNVAGDANAFLGIETSQSKYAKQTGTESTAEIVLNGESGGAGDGVNANADTRFDGVLVLRNNGDQDVSIGISDNSDPNDAFKVWVTGSAPASGNNLTRVDDGSPFVLTTGGQAYISVGTFLRDYSESDLATSLTITADNSIPGGAAPTF